MFEQRLKCYELKGQKVSIFACGEDYELVVVSTATNKAIKCISREHAERMYDLCVKSLYEGGMA